MSIKTLFLHQKLFNIIHHVSAEKEKRSDPFLHFNITNTDYSQLGSKILSHGHVGPNGGGVIASNPRAVRPIGEQERTGLLLH